MAAIIQGAIALNILLLALVFAWAGGQLSAEGNRSAAVAGALFAFFFAVFGLVLWGLA